MTPAVFHALPEYRAVVAAPEEDTPRLMLADWLDEYGDEGDRARAEFIRVQVELTKLPPKHRELFVADGAGQRLEGLGVALIPEGDGHYSASFAESGLSIETFAENERVDIYADRPGRSGPKWVRGLRYSRRIEDRQVIIFRKDAQSGPWAGTKLAEREKELLAKHGSEWRYGPACEKCGGAKVAEIGSGTVRFAGREMPFTKGSITCPECYGTGDAGGLLRNFEYLDAPQPHPPAITGVIAGAHCTFARGFPDGVEVPALTDCVETSVGNAHGEMDSIKASPSRWLAQVLAAHPATRVVPLDRNPGYLKERDSFLWFRSASPQMPSEIHPEIWGRVVLPKEGTFRSDTDAIEALAVAIAKWGRAAR